MKLQEYIQSKEKELVRSGMREAKYKTHYDSEIGRNSEAFMLFARTQPSLDVEVEEIDRSKLPNDYNTLIPAIIIDIDVVKPRCRKPVRKSFYVKTI